MNPMESESFDEPREIALAPVTVIESQERANIDMLVATAKRFPRDLERVQRRMEKMATTDQETAESCSYHLERDGHAIEGPSVVLARIVVACYGNVRGGNHIVSNDGKVVVAQGYCHDCEYNTFYMAEVQRRITDKHGRTYSEDMQITTANAAAAIAFRNAVFTVIPPSVWKSVENAARKFAVGDLKTLLQRRSRLLRRFAALGVNEARILNFLGYENADQITLTDIERLIGIGTAIREETTTIEETFGPTPPTKPNIPQRPREQTSQPAQPPPPPPPTDVSERAEAATQHEIGATPAPAPAPQPQAPPTPPRPPKPAPPEAPSLVPFAQTDEQKTLPEKVAERLAEEGVTVKEFLTVVEAYGFARDKQGLLHPLDEIDSGAFGLADMGDEYLRAAFTNLRGIIDGIEKMRRGEEP